MEKSDHSKEQNQQQDAKQQSAWKDSSPEEVTGKQRRPDRTMGNAANRPQKRDGADRSGPTKINEDDAGEMGSGKRQDDN